MYFRKHVALIDNPILQIPTHKKYHQIRSETECQNLRNWGNSWKTHLKNLISVRWDSYQEKHGTDRGGVDGPGMSKEGFLLFLKKTHLPLDAPNVGPLPFLLGDLEFWILLGFQGIRNSELCFFLAEISGWQRGRKPCFVAESPSSCDMYRVRTESQLLGWSRMTDWHRLGKSGKSKAKRPSQKSEELQSWLVIMRVDIKSEISLNRKLLLFLVSAVVWLVVHDGFASIYQRTNASTTLPH